MLCTSATVTVRTVTEIIKPCVAAYMDIGGLTRRAYFGRYELIKHTAKKDDGGGGSLVPIFVLEL